MNRFSLKLTIAVITFFIGCLAVSFWLFNLDKKLKNSEVPAIQIEEPIAEITEDLPENNSTEGENPLDSLWIEKDTTYFNGYTIKRYCDENQDVEEPCKLKVSQGNKVLDEFYSHNKEMLQYGFFNFLGESEKQLIINTSSGGAHCCYDYYIYDLKPTFRKVYNSSKFDSGSQIGNDLFPIDIDKDGVFEFREDVMAFDYFYESHAGSVFPPAIFHYDKTKGQYALANKQFSKYIFNLITDEWYVKERLKDNEEYLNVRKFFYLIYSGKREDAWKYYDKHLFLNDYFDKDIKEEYRKEVKKIFAKDPTYLSIYGK